MRTGREGDGNMDGRGGNCQRKGVGEVKDKEVGTSKEKKEAKRGDNLERRRWELRGKWV